MEFSQQRFNESDELARTITKYLYEDMAPTWTLIENPNKFGIDYIVYEHGKLVAYIECELSNNGFTDKGIYKYDSIRLLPRKNHFLDGFDTGNRKLEEVPIYLVTVAKNKKGIVVYDMKSMRDNSTMVSSLNTVPYKSEPVLETMYSLPVKFCSTFTMQN